ncbi:MAG: DUF2442 domain-containing protein [Candidatus Muirbacterium halophilum]|nr:DUF2442 domain-containing protein [Candidatus Muirbacterium halophilum]MCK9477332.1 DUF2442 domain-containing protein [Candidatus Muirbacterium halophilum]
MNILPINKELIAKEIKFIDQKIIFILDDDREIGVPLRYFPKLEKATETQKMNYRFIGGGIGVHFPDIDEDISVTNLIKVI